MRRDAFQHHDVTPANDLDDPALDVRQAFLDERCLDPLCRQCRQSALRELSVSAPERVPTPTTVSSMSTDGMAITESRIFLSARYE